MQVLIEEVKANVFGRPAWANLNKDTVSAFRQYVSFLTGTGLTEETIILEFCDGEIEVHLPRILDDSRNAVREGMVGVDV